MFALPFKVVSLYSKYEGPPALFNASSNTMVENMFTISKVLIVHYLSIVYSSILCLLYGFLISWKEFQFKMQLLLTFQTDPIHYPAKLPQRLIQNVLMAVSRISAPPIPMVICLALVAHGCKFLCSTLLACWLMHIRNASILEIRHMAGTPVA